MNTEQIITGATVVLPDEVIKGSIRLENGIITDIDSGRSQSQNAHDAQGDYLIPGMVELHTDNMEKCFNPRPGVFWPEMQAVMAHDNQMITSGITTVFDAISVAYEIDSKSPRAQLVETEIDSFAVAKEKGVTRADHYLHLRCEVNNQNAATEFDRLKKRGGVKLASLMDHAPGQRQFAKIEKYYEYYQNKFGLSDAQMQDLVDRTTADSERYSDKNRRKIAKSCYDSGISIACHDDATPEHIDQAVKLGAQVSEFPTTKEAAHLAHVNNM